MRVDSGKAAIETLFLCVLILSLRPLRQMRSS